ncbi:uncharacterized protein B0H18DRAFT_990685 [Fomitopsis serialis]|uniref:uncharacterized protein n=1 Tax=Fomitopsis serialis TaxID=139415 RepID=UPI002008885E|nr:uncharacterized protein B0H18DRAFT_990685 [Neoantrodia serialis]KAH9931256.1 hypothetical protein B0H18DRAFT_990685 [Neoantrodia serialis]
MRMHINRDIIDHPSRRECRDSVAGSHRPQDCEPTLPATLKPGDYKSSLLINPRSLPPSSFLPSLSVDLDPSVRPPSYAAPTVRAIPSSSMITPYVSTTTPSTAYLADPLNAYAHPSVP